MTHHVVASSLSSWWPPQDRPTHTLKLGLLCFRAGIREVMDGGTISSLGARSSCLLHALTTKARQLRERAEALKLGVTPIKEIPFSTRYAWRKDVHEKSARVYICVCVYAHSERERDGKAPMSLTPETIFPSAHVYVCMLRDLLLPLMERGLYARTDHTSLATL